MNRGHLLQSSPVQQMMATGSPAGWWSINNMRAASAAPPPQQPSQQHIPNQLIPNTSSHFIPTLPSWADHCQEMPESWTQLLSGGLVGEDEQKTGAMEAAKKMQNWEEQVLLQQQQQQQPEGENSANGYNLYENAEFHASAVGRSAAAWSQMMPASSPNSCVTTLSSNMLDFSSNKSPEPGRNPVLPDPSSECNSTGNLGGGAAKKARVQPSSSTQSSFKVRKEKLGDRITALHQLVSPFGKTDTASVLLEAIGYIRFLQSQIEALSLPYLATSKSGNNPRQQQHQVQGGERNCLFPEDPGQLVNENIMKRKAIPDQGFDEEEEAKMDLRSRGLCLVPISCTLQVGSDNGADYWAPALGGGGGFR